MTTLATTPSMTIGTLAGEVVRKSSTQAKAIAAGVMTHPTPEPPPASVAISPQPPFQSMAIINRRRWSLSLVGSIVLHSALIGSTLIKWPFHNGSDAPPPAAMVVELAVMPASPPVPATEIPVGPQQVESAPKLKPLERMKFDPPPQVDPLLKPQFAMPLKPEIQPLETQLLSKDQRETTAPQALPVPKEDKNAAPVDGNNVAPPSDAEQAWESRLLAKLERNKRYPAAAQGAGQQDTVFVRLVLDRNGRLLDASLNKSAGFAMLDSETLALARRASPFPAPPQTISGERIVRIVPVEFYIKQRR